MHLLRPFIPFSADADAFSMRNREHRPMLSPINHGRIKSEIYESRIKIPYRGRSWRRMQLSGMRHSKISVILISETLQAIPFCLHGERFKKRPYGSVPYNFKSFPNFIKCQFRMFDILSRLLPLFVRDSTKEDKTILLKSTKILNLPLQLL